MIQISDGDLSQLSLEELGDIEVTSVSKRPEPLNEAATSIYVITHDEIVRSGAIRLPEVLRYAPNLQVAQSNISPSRYAISARGMNGAQQSQNFPNKLLVLVDGRSVYSPLFSGVYWDLQDVLLQDTDRIEVISGPGATLWGANAVNGVINVTSRSSAETQGLLLDVGAGNQERVGALRYGGRLSDALTFRIYGKGFWVGDTRTATGARINDHWSRSQAGFRADWTPSMADSVTLQGDIYRGDIAQPAARAEPVSGGNLLARWTHSWEGDSALMVKAYYDRVERGGESGGTGFHVDTFDFEAQQGIALGSRNEVTVGGGYRLSKYFVPGSQALQFRPPRRNLHLANVFVQDKITFTPALKLTLGLKLEDNPYIKATLLPSARLSYAATDRLTLWVAASRAVRSATPFDREVVEVVNGSPFLVGGPDFQSEKLVAYEAGARTLIASRVSVSAAVFYHDYDDLRSIEVDPATRFLPLRWGNGLKGHSYGAEVWGDLQAASWWRLSGSFNYLDQKFAFKPTSSRLVGVSQTANDPKWQASLKSSMTWRQFTADAMLRYISALPEPRIPAYAELNGRVAWAINDHVQLAVSGRNLLHKRHIEYVQGSYNPRAVRADIQWRF